MQLDKLNTLIFKIRVTMETTTMEKSNMIKVGSLYVKLGKTQSIKIFRIRVQCLYKKSRNKCRNIIT